MSINIAIDGPSGAGKSSLAKSIAKILSFSYVDTGALYRAIGLYVVENGADPKKSEEVVPLLSSLTVDLVYIEGVQHVLCNGEDVTPRIRRNEISIAASDVSAYKEVREFLLDTQRTIAQHNNVVMDGRDVGTTILPNADLKIYLTASVEDRAQRRYEELLGKESDLSYEKIYKDIEQRDYNDSHREFSPLRKADDAIVLDNSGFVQEQTLNAALDIIKKKLGTVLNLGEI